MRYIKRRRVVLPQAAQARSIRLAVIRWVYLISVFLFAIWLANFFFGSLLFLRSEGLVVSEPITVAAEYSASIKNFVVREGDIVKAGQVIAIVSSQSATETLARLTTDLAGRAARLSELHSRNRYADAMIELAEKRKAVATATRQEYETLLSRGFLSLDKRVAALEGEYRSAQDLETLRAQKESGIAEIEALTPALAEASAAAEQLRRIYDDGKLRAPADGIVIRRIADTGAVIRTGDPILEISSEKRYVLAYVPTGSLHSIAVGDEVDITTGLRSVRGVIARVEPYAAALPREFQRAFTPVERQQVIRIEFTNGDVLPPLFTKVDVRSPRRLPGWIHSLWPF